MSVKSACMGGFCAVRERCARYHVEGQMRLVPAERLCAADMDDQWKPLEVRRPTDFNLDITRRMAMVFGKESTLGATQ